MKRIWLVRHGESRSQTRESRDPLNPALSERGIEPLRDLALDAILISPLLRAWQTYQLAQATAGHVAFDSRLIESDWGILERYAPIAPVTTPDIALADRQDAWLVGVQARATSLIHDLAEGDRERVLLFGHWGVFHHLFLAFVGLDGGAGSVPLRVSMDNTGISLIEVDDGGRRIVRYWNDRAHAIDLLG